MRKQTFRLFYVKKSIHIKQHHLSKLVTRETENDEIVSVIQLQCIQLVVLEREASVRCNVHNQHGLENSRFPN